jgi:AraC family transcriptional regulator
MSESIAVRQGEELVPIVPNVIRRRGNLRLAGLLLEHHAIERSAFPEREPQCHTIYLHTGARVRAEIHSPEIRGIRWIHPGTLWIMPQGSRHAVMFDGPVQGLALAFDPARFSKLVQLGGGSAKPDLVQSLTAARPTVEHLMRALWYESIEPSMPGDIALECVATAIALALAQPVGSSSAAKMRKIAGLAPRQIRAVHSFVEDNLGEAISLSSLADAAGVSSFHFLRSFKQSQGITPGRYVLERRIERAKQMLRDRKSSIGEVAISVGFAHPSHFTRAFRRVTGLAPSAFAVGLEGQQEIAQSESKDSKQR